MRRAASSRLLMITRCQYCSSELGDTVVQTEAKYYVAGTTHYYYGCNEECTRIRWMLDVMRRVDNSD